MLVKADYVGARAKDEEVETEARPDSAEVTSPLTRTTFCGQNTTGVKTSHHSHISMSQLGHDSATVLNASILNIGFQSLKPLHEFGESRVAEVIFGSCQN